MFKKSLILGFVLLFLPLMVSAGVIFRTPTSLGLTSGLVGHWTFDGADIYGTSARDKSGNGNHGTISGTPQITLGKIGQGLESGRNGVGSTVAKSTFSGITGYPFTLSVWTAATPGNNGSMRSVIHLYTDATHYHAIGWVGTTGVVRIAGESGGGFVAKSGSTVGLNKWVHMVGVFNSATDRVLYIDGVVDTTDNVSIPEVPNPTGLNAFYGAGASYMKADDVRIYNRALSANEISRLYNMGASSKFKTPSSLGLLSGLVGHWTFDGNKISGTSALDSSVSNKTGIITGATKTIGKLGQGLNFDGSSDYVSVTNAITLVSPYSVSMWFYPRQIGPSRGLIDGGTGVLTILDGSRIQIVANSAGTFRTWCNKTFTADDLNKWWHLTYIVNSTTNASLWKCYLNSTNVGVVDSDSSGTYKEPTTSWTLGAYYNNSYWFDGVLDDVRIYNRAISDSEIKELYNLGVATKINKSPTNSLTSGLVGYWTFDGADTYWSSATAGTVTDKSGNNNTGTLTNMSRSTSPAMGKLGQAFKFDGADDYVTSARVFNNLPFTLSGWVKSDGSKKGTIVGESASAGTYYVSIGINNDGKAYANWQYNGALQQANGTSNISNKWSLITATYYSTGGFNSSMDLYVNGILESSSSDFNMAGIFSQFNNTAIGRVSTSTPANYMNGSLDDVRIYSRVLSADEIQQLYNMGR